MRLVRAVGAVALVLLGCWCLTWIVVFIGFALVGATSYNPLIDYVKLAAWVPVTWFTAYLIQPWWPHRRRRREGF